MKTWVITPAFCKAALLEDALTYYYRSGHPKFDHVIIDNHYPVAKEENRARIRDLARQYECHYIDCRKDLGLHEGVNKAMRDLNISAEDLLIGIDPDDRVSVGTVLALQEVMRADPTIAVCGTNFEKIEHKLAELPEKQIAGHTLYMHPRVEMWNVAAFNMGFLRKISGLSQRNSHYGGLEVSLFRQWTKFGMKLAYLKYYRSDVKKLDENNPLLFDKSYAQWKYEHAHNGYEKGFEDFLNERKN